MKRYTLRTLLFILLTLTMCTGILPAHAIELTGVEDGTIQPLNIGVGFYECNLTIMSSGKATCYGEVDTKENYTVKSTLELQRSSNGSDWSIITSWNGEGNVIFTKTHYVIKGYDYQLKLTVDIYNSSGKYVTTYTDYSDTVSY